MTENTSETVASTAASTAPSDVAFANGDGAAGARRTMPVEEPRHDPRALGAGVNGVTPAATRGVQANESLRAPVVASQEEIVLAEQLRLELKRKYLNEPR